MLLDEPSLRAKRRPPDEFPAVRTEEDVLVLLDFHRAYRGLPAPRVPICAETVLSEGSLID